jgi:poly(hydroxyalkanoate) depolymerase family esterase
MFALLVKGNSLYAQHEIKFGENPGGLRAFVYAPAEKKGAAKSRPLVVALHGCSQQYESLATATGWNKLADENDFVMLYPNQERKNNLNNCFNWFKTEDIEGETGEVKSIMNMVAYTIKHYNIDTSQIYVYGVSAGAAMGISLLAVYPSSFKAGAIFAGAPYKVAVNNRQALKAMLSAVEKPANEWGKLVTTDSMPEGYPRLMVVHGTHDKVVHPQNTYELIKQWSYLHQIDTLPDIVTDNYYSPLVKRIAYTNTAGAEKIVFYNISTLGHAIAIDPGAGKKQGGTKGLFAKDIGFFSTYYVAKEFGLINNEDTPDK